MIPKEARELQQKAVRELVNLVESKKEVITFKAPTGSGKTYMMADMMNRVITNDDHAVFIVSTLSKGDLAGQNYSKFKEYEVKGDFPHLRPYLINTVLSSEESLHIPTDYNVYVLPRDLYKKGGKLMEGSMENFMITMTSNFFGQGLDRKIYLVRDECHIETRNLNELAKDYQMLTINFSATPKLSRGQLPDVEIDEDEAVRANLIKRVQPMDIDDDEHLADAIDLLQEKRKEYREMGVNPCLIIQVSNEGRADEEWNNIIKPELDKPKNSNLKWMYIVGDDKKCKTNDKIGQKPVSRWKDYAKENESSIDIIIFKMVISEGWDIPRACMLYQIRPTTSRQLDEQVVGRVRRNPLLLDFDTLTSDQKKLAMKAWVWGVMKEKNHQTHQVDLWNEGKEVLQSFKVKTIKLKEMSEQQLQKNHSFVDLQECNYTQSIFNLHKQLSNCDEELQKDCYDYVGNDYSKWFKYTELLPSIKKEYVNFHINYGKSMEIDKEVSFPISSSFSGDDHSVDVPNWVWVKKNGSESFAFDSEAEMKWAVFMGDLCGKQAEVLTEDEEDRYLWGKNFPTNSEIRYQYYFSGIHSSYPDFIMKDKSGKIHIFEVKSFNEATGSPIKEAEYKEKVEKLKECYLACSAKLENYCFYIPILDGDEWVVYAYIGGKEVVGIKTKKDVKTFIKSQNNL